LRASPRSRVVCLTASISHEEKSSLIDAGAVACLTKDEDLEQIVASIHSAAGATA
jgi:DNA-binding NarL/FixJ family response regulator